MDGIIRKIEDLISLFHEVQRRVTVPVLLASVRAVLQQQLHYLVLALHIDR